MRFFKNTAVILAATVLVAPVSAPLLAETKATASDAKMNAAAKVVQRSLDKWRARDFNGWLAQYSSNAMIAVDGMTLVGKEEVRKVYKVVFDAKLKTPEIIESGWTGQRIFVVQREFGPNGGAIGTSYAEYEVKGGKITAVYGSVQG